GRVALMNSSIGNSSMQPTSTGHSLHSPLLRRRRLARRTLLRGTGAVVALPLLETMAATPVSAVSDSPIRMVAINFELSFHPPNLMPQTAGRDYEPTPYLEPFADLRNDFTIISGTSHPDVDGGHAATKSWLTGAAHPGAANFVNTISMDQLAAKEIGQETRLASLAIGSGGISVSSNGVPVPANGYPSRLFEAMFVEQRPQEKQQQIAKLREGQSILDTVIDSAQRMQQRVSRNDKQKLDQYFTSVREAELRLQKSEAWQQKPKPHVESDPPVDIRDQNDIISRAQQLYDIMYLALMTDSTRIITYVVGDSNAVATLQGVSRNYHDLSHHGQDPEKLKQLGIIEAAHIKLWAEFLRRLRDTPEGSSNLLNHSMVLLGSHMHSGGHNNRNLPILFAGGGFQHGQHLAFAQDHNTPLANLYVTMLQRMGLNVDHFATSTGPLQGLNAMA
ncbi:MAG: DUF1552 domain-containing protein, partial [Planctomycetaceae bacterium]|nr:DUF1552 domain-containing protein [Planctomycetaceae bacterium]